MSSGFASRPKKWFLETSFPGVRRCKRDAFLIERDIYRGKTPFQKIHIFESPGFGKVLALDGIIQLSQSDEFIYHEMIAHTLLLSHPSPRRLLIIGGGDGGALREASRHPLQELWMVEIDRAIVRLARRHLPFISRGSFDDRRLRLCFEDGRKFIRRFRGYFDAIIVDSTDPVGPGAVLFQGGFYRDVASALAKNGIAIFQLGPFLDFELVVKGTANKLRRLFRYLNPVRLPMPSYSCGCEYCFMLASKSIDPATVTPAVLGRRLRQRLGRKAGSLRYYSPQLHQASLVMPKMWQI